LSRAGRSKTFIRKKKPHIQNKNTNKQPAISNSNKGDEWHNTMDGGRTHNGEAEVVDLVREHLQTFKKKKKKREREEVRRGG
jgi:superfamily I DNA and/or RNA helicase